jgi:uncharacterized phiE125 gp8 family phage protein
LRIEREETEYNDDLTALINAAAGYVEAETHVTLIETELRATWDTWPGTIIKIPGWPVSTLDSVTYTDADGNQQTVSTTRTNLVQCPATVQPALNEYWPNLQADAINAVNVNFTAGYGTAATDMPPMVRHLLKLLVAHWFKHREAVSMNLTYEVSIAMDALKKLVWVNEFEEFLVQ